ncbi:hypothetical protein [Bradyrhizobium liaoningense]|uniref:hypothetical protein n=1 Tax=Bradyrhizobium liaoningense TaxID=43992 RepID=UPI001BA71E78|nr:hypothetical protein [Bradyrhizobium liaoningense]MBR0947257.1 hypothetical protein [Bradyrhizobium liaoningense]
MLTDLPEATLQNWTNKGYLGDDKLNLGRGVRRRYSLPDVETILYGKDMVDAGIAPIVAFEYAPVVREAIDAWVERIRDRLIEDGRDGDALEDELSDQVIHLVAGLTANPNAGSAAKPYAVQVYSGGEVPFFRLPDGNAVLLLKAGLRKMALVSHLNSIAADSREEEKR